MKTQVIQLFIHDDIVSIRDRMGWAKTPRILLIWPRRGKVDVRPLDLTLLRRHAEFLGAELGLITRDREILTAARAQNISAFSKAPDAQKKRWREKRSVLPARRFPRENLRDVRLRLPSENLFSFLENPLWRIIVFGVGVLAVLAVTLAFIPSADVYMTLPTNNQVLTILVSSDPEIQNAQISGSVPRRELTISQDGAATALPTGNALLPVKTAAGEVILMNLTEGSIRLPAGTILLTHATPQVSFVTTKRVDVPAGKGKIVTVSIRAVLPGPNGNVQPGSITLFDGTFGLQLAVSNPQPTIGGTQSNVVLPTDSDRVSLRKRLLGDLQRQALEHFLAQINAGDELFPSTIHQVQILEENFDPTDGLPGEKLTLKMRVEYQVGYAAYTDLHLLAERVLDASMPVGYITVPGQIKITHASGFTQSQEVIRWQIRTERTIQPVLDAGRVINIVQGKTVDFASEQLIRKFGLITRPQINIQPGWWPWLPFLPIRIAIRG